jgi:glycosyltransferase involved in cell wall biosynthesis
VFAGKCFDKVYYSELKAFIAEHGYENRIVFLGNIPYEELPYLYSSCMIFVYPSTCESFGMTLVEAMACGAPILASQMEPMKEICADAAIYFDPANPAAIADTIYTALQNQNLLSTLTKNAQERAKTFLWEYTAQKTLKIFESTVPNGISAK